MKKWVSILIVLGSLLISLQFIPFSFKNSGVATTSFEKKLNVPPLILNQLKISCFDCHSNQTNYPIYCHLQPINYYMNHHIEGGKDKLNFDDFSTYSNRKLSTKLDEIISQLEQKEMPLSSYTLIHLNAKLSDSQNQKLIDWFKKKKDSLQF
jgi:hypothetical protein